MKKLLTNLLGVLIVGLTLLFAAPPETASAKRLYFNTDATYWTVANGVNIWLETENWGTTHPMTQVKNSGNLFYYDLPSGVNKVVIMEGAGGDVGDWKQTTDITFTQSDQPESFLINSTRTDSGKRNWKNKGEMKILFSGEAVDGTSVWTQTQMTLKDGVYVYEGTLKEGQFGIRFDNSGAQYQWCAASSATDATSGKSISLNWGSGNNITNKVVGKAKVTFDPSTLTVKIDQENTTVTSYKYYLVNDFDGSSKDTAFETNNTLTFATAAKGKTVSVKRETVETTNGVSTVKETQYYNVSGNSFDADGTDYSLTSATSATNVSLAHGYNNVTFTLTVSNDVPSKLKASGTLIREVPSALYIACTIDGTADSSNTANWYYAEMTKSGNKFTITKEIKTLNNKTEFRFSTAQNTDAAYQIGSTGSDNNLGKGCSDKEMSYGSQNIWNITPGKYDVTVDFTNPDNPTLTVVEVIDAPTELYLVGGYDGKTWQSTGKKADSTATSGNGKTFTWDAELFYNGKKEFRFSKTNSNATTADQFGTEGSSNVTLTAGTAANMKAGATNTFQVSEAGYYKIVADFTTPAAPKVTVTKVDKAPAAPEKLYLHGKFESMSNWGVYGTAATKSGNKYTWNNVKFVQNQFHFDTATSDGIEYGAPQKNKAIKVGEAQTLTLYTNVNYQAAEANHNYNVEVDFTDPAKPTVTITEPITYTYWLKNSFATGSEVETQFANNKVSFNNTVTNATAYVIRKGSDNTTVTYKFASADALKVGGEAALTADGAVAAKFADEYKNIEFTLTVENGVPTKLAAAGSLKAQAPAQLYMYGSIGTDGEWIYKAMTKKGNIYTLSQEVKKNSNSNWGEFRFSIAQNEQVANQYGWYNPNESNHDNYQINSLPLEACAMTAGQGYVWKVAPGTYDITCDFTDPENPKLAVKKGAPATLYIAGTIEGTADSSTNNWYYAQMTKKGNKFTITKEIKTLGDKTEFRFSTAQNTTAANQYGWNNSNGYKINNGTCSNVPMYSNELATWTIDPGTYDITVDFTDTKNPKLTVKKESTATSIIYFTNRANWTGKIYAWVWNADNNNENCNVNSTFPGDEMTYDEATKQYYWENTSGKTPTHVLFVAKEGDKETGKTDDLAFKAGQVYSNASEIEVSGGKTVYVHWKEDWIHNNNGTLPQFGIKNGDNYTWANMEQIATYAPVVTENVDATAIERQTVTDKYQIWKYTIEDGVLTGNNVDIAIKRTGSNNQDEQWSTNVSVDNIDKYIWSTGNSNGNNIMLQTYVSYAQFCALDAEGRPYLYMVGEDSNSVADFGGKTLSWELENAISIATDKGGCSFIKLGAGGKTGTLSFKLSWIDYRAAMTENGLDPNNADSSRAWATFDLGLVGIDTDDDGNQISDSDKEKEGDNYAIKMTDYISYRYNNYNQYNWKASITSATADASQIIIDMHPTCHTLTMLPFEPNPTFETATASMQNLSFNEADAQAIHEGSGHLNACHLGHVIPQQALALDGRFKINAQGADKIQDNGFDKVNFTVYLGGEVVASSEAVGSAFSLEHLPVNSGSISGESNGSGYSITADAMTEYTSAYSKHTFHSKMATRTLENVELNLPAAPTVPELKAVEIMLFSYLDADGEEVMLTNDEVEDGKKVQLGLIIPDFKMTHGTSDYHHYSDFKFTNKETGEVLYPELIKEGHYLIKSYAKTGNATGDYREFTDDYYNSSDFGDYTSDHWHPISDASKWNSTLTDGQSVTLLFRNVQPGTELECEASTVYPFIYKKEQTPTIENGALNAPRRAATAANFTGNTADYGFSLAERTTKAAVTRPNIQIETNVNGLLQDKENAEAVYYNLQGLRVENPGHGIYIRVKGNRSEKVAL